MRKKIKIALLALSIGIFLPVIANAYQCNFSVTSGGTTTHISLTNVSDSMGGSTSSYSYSHTVNGMVIASGNESDYGTLDVSNLPCCVLA